MLVPETPIAHIADEHLVPGWLTLLLFSFRIRFAFVTVAAVGVVVVIVVVAGTGTHSIVQICTICFSAPQKEGIEGAADGKTRL